MFDGRTNVPTRVAIIPNRLPKTVLNSESAAVFKSVDCHKCNHVPTFERSHENRSQCQRNRDIGLMMMT